MNSRFAIISFWVCITACLGDVLITTMSGMNYPGYSQLSNTLSQLGSNVSPVSGVISVWWTILGLIFVFLGYLIKKSFVKPGKAITIAAWLLAGYGLGEGVCSGLFPVNYSNEDFDFISMLHIILSGVGVLSVLLFPLVLQRVFTKKKSPLFYNLSYFTVIAGLILILLFTLSKSIDNPGNFFVIYKGLWQRLLTLNFYLYFIVLTTLLLRSSASKVFNE